MNTVPENVRHKKRLLFVVFLVSVLWRGLAIRDVSAAPWFAFRIGDAITYHDWARDIAAGNWLGNQTFYQSPLYPYCLGLVYALFGDSRLLVVVMQALLSSLAAVLLCDAGWRCFSKRTGVIAGLLMATFQPAIFSDLLIQKTSLDLFLVCAQVWLVSRISRQSTSMTCAMLGMTSALLALNRENALLIVFILAGWLWGNRHSGRLRKVLPFAAGVILVLGPVAFRNRLVGDEWHLTTSQFGPNFYIGNHAGATGTYSPLGSGGGDARFERRDARANAEIALGRQLSDAEVSTYWTSRALQFIRSDPAAWARLMMRKWGLFWNRVELTDTEDVYTYAEESLALQVPGAWLNFGVLASIAGAGAWCGWRLTPVTRLLVLLILGYAISVSLFYVMGRYRIPVVPWIMLLAALAIAEGAAWFAKAGHKQRAGAVLTIVTVALLSALPLVDIDRQRTTTHLNFGAELSDRGQWQEAIEEFQKVLSISPRFVDAHFNLGAAYAATGRLDEAAACFLKTLDIDPSYSLASLNLGNVALDQGNGPRAKEWFTHTLKLNPREYRAYNGLGMIAANRNEWRLAVEYFQQAVSLAPEFLPARQNLDAAKRRIPD